MVYFQARNHRRANTPVTVVVLILNLVDIGYVLVFWVRKKVNYHLDRSNLVSIIFESNKRLITNNHRAFDLLPNGNFKSLLLPDYPYLMAEFFGADPDREAEALNAFY